MFSRDDIANAHETCCGRSVRRRHCVAAARRALGAEVVVKHENHLPTGAFKVRGGLTYVEALTAPRAGGARPHLGDARQPRPEPRLCRPARRHAGDDRRAARQFAREERRDAGARRRPRSSTAPTSRRRARKRCGWRRRAACTWFPPSIATSCSASRPMRSNCSSEHPDLDSLYVPIGLGSGICGCIAARDALGLEDRDRRRPVDARAGLCALLRRRPCRSPPRAPTRSPTAWRRACRTRRRWRSSLSGRRAHHAGLRRRDRRRRARAVGPIRTISPKAPARRRSPPR